MKLNELARQTLERFSSQQRAKHEGLYSDLPQADRTFLLPPRCPPRTVEGGGAGKGGGQRDWLNKSGFFFLRLFICLKDEQIQSASLGCSEPFVYCVALIYLNENHDHDHNTVTIKNTNSQFCSR